MATRKSSIGASLVIDRRQFKKALDEAKGDAAKFASSLEAMKMPRSGLLSPGGWRGMRDQIGSVIGKYQHLRAAVTDLTAVAVRAAGAPAMYRDMRDELSAVTGSAKEAAQALDLIASISENYSMEFEPLVEAYNQLRSLGYSAQQSSEFLREMSNAIRRVGGNSADLAAIAGNLGEITDRGEAGLRQLMRFGRQMPLLRNIFEEQFGVRTAEDIENISLTADELFEGLIRGLKRVENVRSDSLDRVGSPEYLASIARLRAGRLAIDGAATIPDLVPRNVESADPKADAERIRILRERAAAAKEAAAAEKKLAEETEAAAKETERMVEENAQIAAREGEQKQFAGDAREEMEIARLRSRGQGKKADKMQADLDEKRRVQQLMESGGLTESAAKSMTRAGERQISEDQAYLDRTGRPKTRGANYAESFSGIPDYADSSLKDEWSFGALDDGKQNMPRPKDSRAGTNQLGVTPDKFSGMTLKQAEEMLEALRAIRAATEANQPTAGQKTAPKNQIFD